MVSLLDALQLSVRLCPPRFESQYDPAKGMVTYRVRQLVCRFGCQSVSRICASLPKPRGRRLSRAACGSQRAVCAQAYTSPSLERRHLGCLLDLRLSRFDVEVCGRSRSRHSRAAQTTGGDANLNQAFPYCNNFRDESWLSRPGSLAVPGYLLHPIEDVKDQIVSGLRMSHVARGVD